MLRGVQDAAGSEQSDAVDALSEQIGNAQARLGDLEGRYDVAGSQLTMFADALEEAQRLALVATSVRDIALDEAGRLERQLDSARDDAQFEADETSRHDAQLRATAISQHLTAVQQDLASAGQTHATALEMVRDAGDVAAEAISGIVGSDGLNDSWWDNFMDVVSANAGWLTVVKQILGVVTAIVGIISIFFPPLAIVAFGLGALTAMLSFTLAAAGEGSWLDFGLDMIGVLTFGVGAIAARGVSLGLKGMQVTRGLTYNRQITTILQRVVHPIATRRAAIDAVGDSFQAVLPVGETLITAMKPTAWRGILEATGTGVEQFKTITTATTLGQSSLASAFIEGLTSPLVTIYAGTELTGSALDVAGLAGFGLEQWNGASDSLPDVPVLDEVASFWGDVQSATTAPMSANWHANAGTP
jgi:hypothetical protein